MRACGVTPAQRSRAEAHIVDLGRKHHITIRRVSSWRKAGAFYSSRLVYVPRTIREPIDYLTALHELGHLIYRPSSMRVWAASSDLKAEIVCEAAAWAWALDNVDHRAVPKMTAALRDEIGGCWTSFFHLADFRPSTVKV